MTPRRLHIFLIALALVLLVPAGGSARAAEAQGFTPQNVRNILQSVQNGQMNAAAAAQMIQTISGGQIDAEAVNAVTSLLRGGQLNLDSALQLAMNMPGINGAIPPQLGSTIMNLMEGGGLSTTGARRLLSDLAEALAENGQQQGQIAQALTDALGEALQTDNPGQFQQALEVLLGDVTITIGSTPIPLSPVNCGNECGACASCQVTITSNHNRIRQYVSQEFERHRSWLKEELFMKHVLPALTLMTSQLTTVGMQQLHAIGQFFDAKHQLETQRMLQGMGAQAHKDYQPSEGLCEIGTNLRSLAASERNADLATHTIAARAMQRQLLSGDVLSTEEGESDRRGRLEHFVSDFCNKTDNGNGLDYLCKGSTANPARMNRDIDYTRTVETELTLDLDFTPEDDTDPSDDEEDIFALGANLFAHEVLPGIPSALLANDAGLVRAGSALYLDLRSVAAKRSVAQNSFAALAGMRAAGDTEVQPFLYKLVEELGVPEDELTELLGERPSYFAQMEVLTKKLYQNPVFYTELYDKPANVARKEAALQAVNLMQDRDIYKSLLRSEILSSVALEMMLVPQQDAVDNEINRLVNSGDRPGGGGP